jgi:palmitoyltransferase
VGFFRNLKSVLGPNPLLWLWPQKMRGDGLSFPVTPDAGGESAGIEWAHLVAPRPLGDGDGDVPESISSTLAHGLGFAEERHRRKDDGRIV